MASRVSAVTLVAVLVTAGCHRSADRTWPDVSLPGAFSAALRTRWKEGLLYIQLTVRTEPAFSRDSVPRQGLLRLWDDGGFEVVDVTVPLTSTGAADTVYANMSVPCPDEQAHQDHTCTRHSYITAARWTLLPYHYSRDPERRSSSGSR